MSDAVDYTLPPALDAKIDKAVFKKNEIVLAVGLPLGKEFKNVSFKLRDLTTGYLALPRFNSIYTDSNGEKRKLALIRKIDDPKMRDHLRNLNIDFPTALDEDISYLESNPNALLPENCPPVQGDDGRVLPSKPCAFRLFLEYENLSFDRALKVVLPTDMDAITGFSLVGHVAHFNLKPAALPYRKLIGQIALDKLPQIRTVVNKASKIDTEFRTFAVDLMAGEDNYLTEVKENGVTFHLDFSKVYWNSRLGTEHSRIIDEVKGFSKAATAGPVVVYDVFAGVGPFSLPLARSGICKVLANDLNPVSFYFLQENVRRNSSNKYPLNQEKIECFNLDGKDFIRQVVLPHFEKAVESGSTEFFMLMNLPGSAIEFLDVFKGFSVELSTPIPIHTRCYCFVRHNIDGDIPKSDRHAEADKIARIRICEALGAKPDAIATDDFQSSYSDIRLTRWTVRFVRNTAPFKDMYCLEFDLHFYSTSTSAKRPRTE